jgi:prepilin-type N-terminal cleavage/methylation domain-containing protein
MKLQSQKGFTLIELILVVVVVGLISVVAVPSLTKARDAADSAAAVGHLRAIHTDQSVYKSQAGRYARLSEINSYSNGVFGKNVGSTLRHRDFIYLMYPTPNNESLRSEYNVIGYRVRSGRVISQYNISESGSIVTVLP